MIGLNRIENYLHNRHLRTYAAPITKQELIRR